MSAIRTVRMGGSSVIAAAAGGRELKSVKDLAEFVREDRSLTSADYELLGQVAVAMASSGYGAPADRDALLKLRDVYYIPLPGKAASAAFGKGEDAAAARLAGVDPRGSAFAAYIADLARASSTTGGD